MRAACPPTPCPSPTRGEGCFRVRGSRSDAADGESPQGDFVHFRAANSFAGGVAGLYVLRLGRLSDVLILARERVSRMRGQDRPRPPRREIGGLPQAKRSLGQNFLVDENIQRKIVKALEAGPDDEVMEIGPGVGALTKHIAGRVRRLVLVELDDDLAERQRVEHAADPSVEVVHADVLDVALESVTREPARLRVIGNIPYNITTPILFSLLERRPRPAAIVLMVQREVADRILAEPGGKEYGALAVGVRAVATAKRVLNVSRTAFRPVPDVESAVIRIDPIVPPPVPEHEETALRSLTRAAFGQRRKQFQRILRDACGLSPETLGEVERELGIDLRQRPETFPPGTFVTLARALRARGAFPTP